MSEGYKISNEAIDKFKAAVLRRVKYLPDVSLPPTDVPLPTWQGWAEIPVTPEMIAAGLAAMSDDPMVTDRYDAERLYRAMHAYRPVVTDPRNAAAEIARLHDELKALTDERDVMRDEMGTQAMRMVSLLNSATMMNDAIKTLEARVAAREARICELDDLLAQRPESVPDTPKPVHDFTRVEGGDRRRVGG